MPSRYHFVTTMELSSTPTSVEHTLQDVSSWPDWWRWAERIEQTVESPPGAVGARYRNEVRTPMLYGF
ncbi:MAG: hypothetical protein R3246_07350, partial [Acidimicrobiia bacterium]|nr:hypothetical protein [Acidimicrobiia bacterium]